jgi:hypothetical protein
VLLRPRDRPACGTNINTLEGRVEDEAMYLVNLAATGVGIIILMLVIMIVWGDWP